MKLNKNSMFLDINGKYQYEHKMFFTLKKKIHSSTEKA